MRKRPPPEDLMQQPSTHSSISSQYLGKIISTILDRKESENHLFLEKFDFIVSYLEYQKRLRYNRIMERIRHLRGINGEQLEISAQPELGGFGKKNGDLFSLPTKAIKQLEEQVYLLIKQKGFGAAVEEIMWSFSCDENLPTVEELEALIVIPTDRGYTEETRQMLFKRERTRLYEIYRFHHYYQQYRKWYQRVMNDILEIIKKRMAKENSFLY